ncbi:MAG: DUF21 domain-containing protein, partial [Actinomycetales bacterium]
MSADSPGAVLAVVGLVLVAGLLSAAEAALAGFSRSRAEGLVAENRAGASRVLHIVDDATRYVNTTLFLRLLAEISAIVLATFVVEAHLTEGRWAVLGVTVAIMLVVSFVVIGVAPRTLGRQHAETIALGSAGVVMVLTRVLGPLPHLLIL